MRSGQASISGLSAISQPIAMAGNRANFETASIISTSVSSALSDGAASREGLSDDHNTATPQRYSPPSVDPEAQRRLNKYEDDGYRLRLALHELSQNLGPRISEEPATPAQNGGLFSSYPLMGVRCL